MGFTDLLARIFFGKPTVICTGLSPREAMLRLSLSSSDSYYRDAYGIEVFKGEYGDDSFRIRLLRNHYPNIWKKPAIYPCVSGKITMAKDETEITVTAATSLSDILLMLGPPAFVFLVSIITPLTSAPEDLIAYLFILCGMPCVGFVIVMRILYHITVDKIVERLNGSIKKEK